MRTLILLIAILFCGISMQAQDIFFPSKAGMVLTYKSFDKKDKLASVLKYTIKEINTRGNDMDITYLIESLDNKEKLVFKEEVTIQQKDDILYLDMSNFMNKAVFQQNGEIPAEVQVKGNNMEMPRNPQPGQMLPDANVEMALKMGFVSLKVSAEVINRKVEAIEDVTVGAGTFKAYKLTNQVNSVAMGIKVQTTGTEWYAKGIGLVKTESYDKKGELLSRMELVDLKK